MGQRRRVPLPAAAAIGVGLLASLLPAARAGEATYLVMLREKAPLGAGRGSAPAARRALADTARRTQAPLLARLEQWRREGEVQDYHSLWITNAIILRASAGVLQALRADPAVASVDPSAPVRTSPVPRTRVRAPGDPTAWNVQKIGAPLIWTDYANRGAGVRIGVLDSGVDLTHPDLGSGRLIAWKDFTDPANTSPNDPHGHGTMICSTLVGGNAGGTALGVAPQARLIVGRMLNASGDGNSAWTLAAMQWVMDPDGNPDTSDGADVVNCSWGGPSSSPNLDAGFRDAIDAWRAAGIFSAFAIGNSGPGARTTYSPGDYPDALGVGAVNRSDVVASVSSHGPVSWSGIADLTKPDLSAPGEEVLVARAGGGYALGTGSSHACPHVTATAALALSVTRARGLLPNVDEIGAALKASAVDLGSPGVDNTYGAGRINAREAVRYLVDHAATVGTTLSVRGLATFAVSLRAGASRQALGLGQVPMKTWDPAAQAYVSAPDALEPGRGYWLKAAASTPVVLSGQGKGDAATLPLKPGWNLISSPFVAPAEWDLARIQVQQAGQPLRPLGQAANLVGGYAWGWQQDGANPDRGTYVIIYDDAVLPAAAHQLVPWKGYWLRAKAACSLVLPAPGRSAASRKRRDPPPGWSVRIEARTREGSGAVVIGSLARRALMAPPPPQPPAGSAGISAVLECNGTPLAVDVRAAAGPQEWSLVVGSASQADGEEVTLAWPDLRALPKDVSLTLVDTATGVRRSLRTTTACTFRAGGTPRRFRILAERRMVAAPLITGIEVMPLRSGTRAVRFTLSGPASVAVEVLAPTGRVLDSLARGRAMAGGANQVAWVGTLAPGVYLLRVTAAMEEGTAFRAVAPAAIVR